MHVMLALVFQVVSVVFANASMPPASLCRRSVSPRCRDPVSGATRDAILVREAAAPDIARGSWLPAHSWVDSSDGQTRLRLVVDDEMGKLFEVAVRRKVGGRSDGGGVEQVEEQVVRGMVEDHEVTASGDVLYLRCVRECTHSNIRLGRSHLPCAAGGRERRHAPAFRGVMLLCRSGCEHLLSGRVTRRLVGRAHLTDARPGTGA